MKHITVDEVKSMIQGLQPTTLKEIITSTESQESISFWAGGKFPNRYAIDWQNSKIPQRFHFYESNLGRAVKKYNDWVDDFNKEQELSGSCNDTQLGSNFLVGYYFHNKAIR